MTVSQVSVAEAAAVPGSEGVAEEQPQKHVAPSVPAMLRPALVGVGISASLAALLVLGFITYLYGLSGLSEARAQGNLYKSFSAELALATAPVGPTAEGAPVAILNIPALGISDLIVVEGSTSGDMMCGPGHVRSSVLPGQSGVSVIYGRGATFGAPFAHLMRLSRGDKVFVTTGQGTSIYQVESFGTSTSPAPDQTINRLILESSNSGIFPTRAVMVSADLRSSPQPSPGGLPQITPQERDLAGDPSALVPLALWSQVLLLASVGAVFAANLWARWPTYVCFAPIAFALAWCVYENLAALLPNLL